MFNNLRHELQAKKISLIAYARLLGVSEKSVQNKLNGITEFTLSEIKTTLNVLPEFKLDYLFAAEDKSA